MCQQISHRAKRRQKQNQSSINFITTHCRIEFRKYTRTVRFALKDCERTTLGRLSYFFPSSHPRFVEHLKNGRRQSSAGGASARATVVEESSRSISFLLFFLRLQNLIRVVSDLCAFFVGLTRKTIAGRALSLGGRYSTESAMKSFLTRSEDAECVRETSKNEYNSFSKPPK